MGNLTFAIIKPDAVRNNNIGHILTMITEAGFKVKAMKMTRMSLDSAKGFYEVHKGRGFFQELVEFMS